MVSAQVSDDGLEEAKARLFAQGRKDAEFDFSFGPMLFSPQPPTRPVFAHPESGQCDTRLYAAYFRGYCVTAKKLATSADRLPKIADFLFRKFGIQKFVPQDESVLHAVA